MSIFRKFRAAPRTTTQTGDDRILKRGPNDRPAGIRHNHTLARSTNGLW